MKILANLLYRLGVAWLFLASCLILLGYASILYFRGVGELLETLSPFNVYNYLAVALTLAPGLLLTSLAKRLGGSK